MQKRGQITIFLVIGIIILLLAAGFFFIFSKIKKAPLEVEAEEARKFLGVPGTVQNFVEKCIKATVDPAIYLLAIQGGVIYPEKDSLILLTDYGLINYAWINGVSGLFREKMEKDLATYLEENIDFCLIDFESFKRQNITVEPDYRKIQAEIIIQKSTIKAELTLPLQIVLSNGDIATINAFSAQQQSSLGAMVEVIEALKFPDLGPQDFFDLPYQPVILPFDESVTIYSLSRTDPNEPLSFFFAVRNDFPKNEPPTLAFIPDKTFRVGDIWQEELLADDPNNDILSYSSDSSTFLVSKEGAIDAELTTAGIFEVTFTVEDGRGGKDAQKLSILVIEK